MVALAASASSSASSRVALARQSTIVRVALCQRSSPTASTLSTASPPGRRPPAGQRERAVDVERRGRSPRHVSERELGARAGLVHHQREPVDDGRRGPPRVGELDVGVDRQSGPQRVARDARGRVVRAGDARAEARGGPDGHLALGGQARREIDAQRQVAAQCLDREVHARCARAVRAGAVRRAQHDLEGAVGGAQPARQRGRAIDRPGGGRGRRRGRGGRVRGGGRGAASRRPGATAAASRPGRIRRDPARTLPGPRRRPPRTVRNRLPVVRRILHRIARAAGEREQQRKCAEGGPCDRVGVPCHAMCVESVRVGPSLHAGGAAGGGKPRCRWQDVRWRVRRTFRNATRARRPDQSAPATRSAIASTTPGASGRSGLR